MNAWKTALGIVTRFQWQNDDAAVPRDGVFVRMPLVGALLGLALAVCADLLLWLAHRGAGTLLGAGAVFALWWWLTDGRGARGIIALTEAIFSGPGDMPTAMYGRVTLFQALLCLRLLCIGILLYLGRSFWLIVVTSLTAATFAEMLRAREPAIPGEENAWSGLYGHWLAAALVVLIAAGFGQAFVAGVVALVIAWLLPATLERLFSAMPLTAETATYGGTALVETLLLLLGVIFFMAS